MEVITVRSTDIEIAHAAPQSGGHAAVVLSARRACDAAARDSYPLTSWPHITNRLGRGGRRAVCGALHRSVLKHGLFIGPADFKAFRV
ncbi:hypothetical protein EVAR_23661_1 [Eumeta japonica]|uniref:Uncharacterized protein n=1 Tax=Eumeta variegata TaxID=151549 RepID=A0A4C1VL41_EUMVA|nr:hypothetical protein EVAR_23661_1 [Eumeta japonica]